MITVKVKKLTTTAKLPVMAKPGDAAYDLFADEDVSIGPQEWKLVKTGIAIELPPNTEAQIRPRSGLALKNGITVLNSPGTVDSGYRGEIGVILTAQVGMLEIKKGDRIAQMAIRDVPPSYMVEVAELTDTARGSGGFGSTGVRT